MDGGVKKEGDEEDERLLVLRAIQPQVRLMACLVVSLQLAYANHHLAVQPGHDHPTTRQEQEYEHEHDDSAVDEPLTTPFRDVQHVGVDTDATMARHPTDEDKHAADLYGIDPLLLTRAREAARKQMKDAARTLRRSINDAHTAEQQQAADLQRLLAEIFHPSRPPSEPSAPLHDHDGSEEPSTQPGPSVSLPSSTAASIHMTGAAAPGHGNGNGIDNGIVDSISSNWAADYHWPRSVQQARNVAPNKQRSARESEQARLASKSRRAPSKSHCWSPSFGIHVRTFRTWALSRSFILPDVRPCVCVVTCLQLVSALDVTRRPIPTHSSA